MKKSITNSTEKKPTEEVKKGRPKKFQSVEEMEKLIESYFIHCDNPANPKPYTITGLAVWLDTDRNTLLDYENYEKFPENEPFFRTIKRAKAKIQQFAEESLWKSGITAGVIFNLKNNWGWKDKTEQELSGPDGKPIKTESTISQLDSQKLKNLDPEKLLALKKAADIQNELLTNN